MPPVETDQWEGKCQTFETLNMFYYSKVDLTRLLAYLDVYRLLRLVMKLKQMVVKTVYIFPFTHHEVRWKAKKDSPYICTFTEVHTLLEHHHFKMGHILQPLKI